MTAIYSGISYCTLLLHDTMLKEDCYRSGTSATQPVTARQKIDFGTLFTLLQQIQ